MRRHANRRVDTTYICAIIQPTEKAMGRRRANVPARGTTMLRRPVMRRDTTPIVLTPQDEARFWAKVDKSPGQGPHGQCHEWQACSDGNGYGMFEKGKRALRAHRIAWTLANGPIPVGMIVCHKCDNPPCCNPQCLFLGTDADNAADRHGKGRSGAAYGERNARYLYPERTARGTANGNAKLTEQDVAWIVAEFAAGGVSKAELARKYGVDRKQIYNIVEGRQWCHLSPIAVSQ